MNMNPVGWFEIYVQDMQRAKAFYEAVQGYTLQPLSAPEGAGGNHPNMEMWAFPAQMGNPGPHALWSAYPTAPQVLAAR